MFAEHKRSAVRPAVLVRRLTVAAGLAATLFGAAACTGQPAAVPHAAVTTPAAILGGQATAPGAIATSQSPVSAPTPSATPSHAPAAASGPAPCGNGDLEIYDGYGNQSDPDQASAEVFVNISDRTCTLQGYPGVAITGDGKTFNATRVLNGARSALPPLTSPPLVTLAPKATAYAVVQWVLATGSKPTGCFPVFTGAIEVTAPGTTGTVVTSKAVLMGPPGICSGLQVNPVMPGVWGVDIAPPKNPGVN